MKAQWKMIEKEGIEETLPGACSCMTLTSKSGKHYWFRTCDIENDIWQEGAHVIKKMAGEQIVYCNEKKENSRYSYVGMTYNAKDTWLLDGINEHGLTGGLLMLMEGTSVKNADEEKEGYVGMELITKMLSACKNVEEVIDLAETIQVLDIPYGEISVPATMHYFFVDTSGDEVILEAADSNQPGILRIFSKEEMIGVMTNSPPYEEQLQNLSWFLSQSAEMKKGLDGQPITEIVLDGRKIKSNEKAKHLSLSGNFPGAYSPYDRFIRLSIMKYLNDSGNAMEDEQVLALGSNIMNTVCEPFTKGMFHYNRLDAEGNIVGQKPSYTQYLCMYDIEGLQFKQKRFDTVIWDLYAL